jgi:hypothetical protein
MLLPLAIRLVEGLVELTDMAFAIVGKLAVRIYVVNKESQSTAFTTHGVFVHLYVAVGIAECQNWTVTDELIDPHRFRHLNVDLPSLLFIRRIATSSCYLCSCGQLSRG